MSFTFFSHNDDATDMNPEARAGAISQLIVVGLVLVAVLILAIRWKSTQHVQSIVIEGVKALRHEEILSLASLTIADTTQSASSKRLAVIRDRILKHPYVKDVIVETSGIKGIKITVTEKQPYIAFPSSMGKIDYVDSTGTVLPYEKFSHTSDVPIVHGIHEGSKINRKMLSSIVSIIEMAKLKDMGLQELLSEIDIDKKQNEYTFITTDGETQIKFGTPENIDRKLEKLRLYMVHSATRQGHPTYVDIRWKNQIVIGKQPLLASKDS
ncbi:MAG: cell division protein FtsQ/DivIB [Candidatus Kapaibacteriota bacterium]